MISAKAVGTNAHVSCQISTSYRETYANPLCCPFSPAACILPPVKTAKTDDFIRLSEIKTFKYADDFNIRKGPTGIRVFYSQ